MTSRKVWQKKRKKCPHCGGIGSTTTITIMPIMIGGMLMSIPQTQTYTCSICGGSGKINRTDCWQKKLQNKVMLNQRNQVNGVCY